MRSSKTAIVSLGVQICLLFSLISEMAQGSEIRKEVFQTMTHCDSEGRCKDRLPDCTVTLTYKDDRVYRVLAYGIGEDERGFRLYYAISNDPERFANPNGPQVKSNQVTSRGNSIYAKLVTTAMEDYIWRLTNEVRVNGFKADTIESVNAITRVRFFGKPSGWNIVRCQKLVKVHSLT